MAHSSPHWGVDNPQLPHFHNGAIPGVPGPLPCGSWQRRVSYVEHMLEYFLLVLYLTPLLEHL